MAKKVFIYVAGSLILAPIVMALCCNSLLYITFAIAYAVIVWNSPKFCTRIKRFWLEFWKINIQLTK